MLAHWLSLPIMKAKGALLYKLLGLFVLITFINEAIGQTVRLNEIASTNVSFPDEDGDTPDWFELYNGGLQTINLNGWSISDKSADSSK